MEIFAAVRNVVCQVSRVGIMNGTLCHKCVQPVDTIKDNNDGTLYAEQLYSDEFKCTRDAWVRYGHEIFNVICRTSSLTPGIDPLPLKFSLERLFEPNI